MNIQKLIRVSAFTSFALIMLLVSGSVLAQQVRGVRIIGYHLNSTVDGRGACVQTLPALPAAVGGWACVWNDHLFENLKELLLHAWLYNRRCTIGWTRLDPNRFAIIDYVDCRVPGVPPF